MDFRTLSGSRAPLADRLRAAHVRSILLVETAWLGDVVFVSVLAQALAAGFPNARVTLLCAPRGRDVGACMPGVSEVIVYDKHGADEGPAAFTRLLRHLRARRFDLSVSPHRSARTALLSRLVGAPLRLGYATPPGALCFTDTVPDRGGRFAERDLTLARALGIEKAFTPRLDVNAVGRASATRALAQHGVREDARLVGLVIGSERATKRWPAEHFGSLAASLLARGLTPLLLGSPEERVLGQLVRQIAPNTIDIVGNTVLETLGLLERCELVVGGDTGLVHAARALGRPTVPLFGPTDPAAHLFGERDRPQWLTLPCAPCSKSGPRRCPLGHHKCLRELKVAKVLAAAVELV